MEILLAQWEESYKKGLLSFLAAAAAGPSARAYPYEIKAAINALSP